ncbi:pentatricopeptide repeat-containing protein at3g22690 [Phtheirospermum japonicum]|uniref:Pentatricopeptide repeat-containing protein at3g22690 n=1 Tax=Phtheirospermum japonicum TaxID=374723 RepID=A0A830DG75_9LAMI|nr:pentatricopeptide repeat-containing protein at3g22690 [Phtheirospermum japonicum]
MQDQQRPQTSARPPDRNPSFSTARRWRSPSSSPPPSSSPSPPSTTLSLFSPTSKTHTHQPTLSCMIRGFTKLQSPKKSIFLLRHMIEHSVRPNEFTFPGILKACSKLRALKEGEQIHAHVVKLMDGLGNIEFVEHSLVYMYACCGHLDLVHKVFDGMSERSAIT